MQIINIFLWLFGKRFSGFVPQKTDKRDFKLKTGNSILESVSLSRLMNPAKDQKWLNACTAFAISELFNYIAKYKKSFSWENMDFSENYQWYMNRLLEGTQEKNVGVYLRESFKTIMKYGFTKNSVWSFEDGWKHHPSDNALIHADFLKLYLDQFKGYFYVSKGDLATVKKCLSDGYPLVFGIAVDKNFLSLSGNGIVNSMGFPKFNHGMLVTGYKNGYVEVRNSWGTKWGNNGYCMIKEELFKEKAYDIWTLR